MRLCRLCRFLLLAFVASVSLSLSGCGKQEEATGPELGAIEAYLQEHPEEAVDNPDEAEDEAEEFDAGS